LRSLHALDGFWRLAGVVWLVPAPLRNALYRWLARKRYRWFGRSQTGLLPPDDAAWRFPD